MEELIRKVLFTLDKVEVKGRENLDRLLGCMQALEKIADAMKHNREALGKAQQDSPECADGQAAQQEGGK